MTTSFTGTKIDVTYAAYDAADFPEASHYSEFVASRLTDLYPGAIVEVEERGHRTRVLVDGVPDSALSEEIRGLVANELWEEFCAEGHKAFSAGVR